MASVTTAQAIAQAIDDFQASVDSQTQTPQLDIELLLATATGRSRASLKAFPERIIEAGPLRQFRDWVARRAQGEPVAYLLSERGFWTLDLAVSPAVLIPRPETELLVDLALQLASAEPDVKPWQVADLGTGSGAIALALASEKPHWQVWATDISDAALAVARENADRLKLPIQFAQGAWTAALPDSSRWNMIVSNPPYISDQDPHLAQGDLRFEPRSALVAADDGFQDLYIIASQAADLLVAGGWLLLEHGHAQGSELRRRLQALGYVDVNTVRDLAGHERVTTGRRPAVTGEDDTHA